MAVSKACSASLSACESSDTVQGKESEFGLNQIGDGHDVNMCACLHACTSVYVSNLIAMLMLSAVVPTCSCVCCCLLVSVLSSCVMYVPMY